MFFVSEPLAFSWLNLLLGQKVWANIWSAIITSFPKHKVFLGIKQPLSLSEYLARKCPSHLHGKSLLQLKGLVWWQDQVKTSVFTLSTQQQVEQKFQINFNMSVNTVSTQL